MATLSPRWVGAAALTSLLLACPREAPLPAADPGTRLVRCAGPARSVFAVGAFDDWNASEAPLAPQPDGSFAASLSLGPGVWTIACERHLADGSTSHEPPVNADRLVDDGFGGQDGVFDVPGEIGSETGRPRPTRSVTSGQRARP